ncbi:coagulation factor IIIb [Callorhinchus milii]|uniref:Tissue factor n=1 Tax=Callorhinchus milii TaxID=7868 RepID=V9KSP0_CALMI|nr:coagulation factor IIIb [Callorhinchus milii]|eukprot:gi/632940427/ref/XP_007885313.1/ PREDICTED: tissue factor [Callorhinchus milii]
MGRVSDCAILLGFAMVCLHGGAVSGLLSAATNVTWKSILFRTELRWDPPLADFVYTVRVKGKRTDWKKKPECTRAKITRCDITSLLENVTDTYNIEIMTYSQESTDEPEEAPHAEALPITPYKDTEFGQADFEIILINKTKVQVSIKDQLTFIRFPDGTLKTLRDIYGATLLHDLIYFKDGTSGKKTITTNSQKILIDVEEDFKYCFNILPRVISPYIKGPSSANKCTTNQISILGEYNVGVFAAVIIGILVLVIIVVVIAVVLNKKKQVKEESEMYHLKPV